MGSGMKDLGLKFPESYLLWQILNKAEKYNW